MDDDALLDILHLTVDAVGSALSGLDDWGLAGTRPGQYRHDLAADAVAVEVLVGAGLGVLSEESGLTAADRPFLAVIDPVDGSTNASRGIPWWATSVCVLDDEGPRVAVVADMANGRRYQATRGGGATLDGRPVTPSGASGPAGSLVSTSGLPGERPPWTQTRMLGAAALEMCAVADGTVDGFMDCVASALGPWDYMGALLVCSEAGAAVADSQGRELVVRSHHERRTPVAAATPSLLTTLLEHRRTLD